MMASRTVPFLQESVESVYDIEEEIGSGQFAVVRRCRHKQTGQQFAAKSIRKRRSSSSRRGAQLHDIEREVSLLSELDHDNIVKLYEVYETQQDVTLILELMTGGELFDYLASREKVDEATATMFLRQVLEGLRHLHQRNIVHLDLKPENLMLVDNERLKIIDFGLARKLTDNVECREMLGTPEFVAPEVVNFDPLSLATDMWSVGVIAFILLSGCSPFLGADKLSTLSNVTALSYTFDYEHFSEVSDAATDFIRQLLIKDSRRRATVEQCLAHPWISPTISTCPLITPVCDKLTNSIQLKTVDESNDAESGPGHTGDNKQHISESAVTENGSCHVNENGVNESAVIESGSDCVAVTDIEKCDVIDSGSGRITIKKKPVSNCREDGNVAVKLCRKTYILSGRVSDELSVKSPGDGTEYRPSINSVFESEETASEQVDICRESDDEVEDVQRAAVIQSENSTESTSSSGNDCFFPANCDVLSAYPDNVVTQSALSSSSDSTNYTNHTNDFSFTIKNGETTFEGEITVDNLFKGSETDGQRQINRRLITQDLPTVHKEGVETVSTEGNETDRHHRHANCQLPTVHKDTDHEPLLTNCRLNADNLMKTHSMCSEADQRTKRQLSTNYIEGIETEQHHKMNCPSLSESERSRGRANCELPLLHKRDMLVDCDVNLPHNVWTTVINHNSLTSDDARTRTLSHGATERSATVSSPCTTTTTVATTPVHDAGHNDSSFHCQPEDNLHVVDENGNTSLHVAAAEGRLDIVRYLLRSGFDANLQNKDGNTALHFAVCQGHTEVVRWLLIYGARTTLRNYDGRSAEIAAIRSGFGDVVEMVTRVNSDRQLHCARQLEPCSRPLSRIKLKVFGDSGVGKTTLIESLKCGYLGGLLRSTFRSSPSPAVTTDMAASAYRATSPADVMCDVHHTGSHPGYTRGITVEQATLNGVGEVSMWEFSGYEPYHVTYDLFIGDANCINIIVVSLCDSADVRLSQLVFWLNFIKTRLAPQQTFGFAGKRLARPRVMIVATHADVSGSVTDDRRSADTSAVIVDTVAVKFADDFDVVRRLFAINCLRPTYAELKAVRLCLAEMRTSIVSSLPASTGLLEATTSALPSWRKQFCVHPVLTWPKFADRVRQMINILCSLEHLHKLVYQLQLTGEIIYIEAAADDTNDLVVLNPQWLCCDVIGQLLSHDQVTRCRPIGRFSLDEVHVMFPDSSVVKLVSLLQTMELCSAVVEDMETVEFEFMSLNFLEASDAFVHYDNDANQTRWIYGGTRLVGCRGVGLQFTSVFPRVQTRLRRRLEMVTGSQDCDLDQWYGGSRLVTGNDSVQLIVSASIDCHAIDIKCRATPSYRLVAFQLLASVCRLVTDVLADCLPSLAVEQQTLSVFDLSTLTSAVSAYAPTDIRQMLESNISNTSSGGENIVDLVALGSSEIFSALTVSTLLPLSIGLSVSTRRTVAKLLDQSHPTGHDWHMLAMLLGLRGELESVDSNKSEYSPTDRCLASWIRRDGDSATVSELSAKLSSLGRRDVADCLLSGLPVFVYQPPR